MVNFRTNSGLFGGAAFFPNAERFARRGPPDSARAFPLMPETADTPPSFEAALSELEAIVARMEGGQLPLRESLEAYERGARLLQFCQSALRDAQQQIEILEKGVRRGFAPEAGDDGR